jgi:hypothetical protein
LIDGESFAIQVRNPIEVNHAWFLFESPEPKDPVRHAPKTMPSVGQKIVDPCNS